MVAITKKIKSLIQQINDHNYRYYILDDPLISDGEYDQLFRKLEQLEEPNPELLFRNPQHSVLVLSHWKLLALSLIVCP